MSTCATYLHPINASWGPAVWYPSRARHTCRLPPGATALSPLTHTGNTPQPHPCCCATAQKGTWRSEQQQGEVLSRWAPGRPQCRLPRHTPRAITIQRYRCCTSQHSNGGLPTRQHHPSRPCRAGYIKAWQCKYDMKMKNGPTNPDIHGWLPQIRKERAAPTSCCQ